MNGRPRALALLLCCLLLLPARAGAQANQVAIEFSPPGGIEEGTAVPIVATVSNEDEISFANLFVRPVGQAAFLPISMRLNGNQLQADIPSSLLRAPGVEYFLSVTDVNNNTVTFPAAGPQGNPLRLSVAPAATEFVFRIPYPSSGAVITESKVVFRLEHNLIGGGLDPSSLKLFVDGKDAAGSCDFGSVDSVCPLSFELDYGTHTVVAAAESKDGPWAQPLVYKFYRSSAKGMPVSFHGKATADFNYLRVHELPDRPLSMPMPAEGDREFPSFDVDGRGTFGTRTYTLRARRTGIDRREQPSPDRYALSVKGAHDVLNLGDFQRPWTELGLGPSYMRGAQAGIETRSRAFAFEALAAQTRRAIEDPQFFSGTFAQYLYGASLLGRVGDRLSLRLYGLDARDDGASIRTPVFISPAASAIVGAEASIKLAKTLTLKNELAFNRYAADLRSGERAGGRAHLTKLSQDARYGSWSALYKRATPSYVSLNNYSVQSDYDGVEGEGAIRVPSGAFLLFSSLQAYHDNTEGQKPGTNRFMRHQTNATIRVVDGWPNLNAGYGEQRQSLEPTSTLRLKNRTRNFSAGLQQAYGPVNWGYVQNLTQFRDISATPLAHDSDTRVHSVNLSYNWSGFVLSSLFNYAVSLDDATGQRTRNLTYTFRAFGMLFRKLATEAAYSGTTGHDNRSSVDLDQRDSTLKLEWEYRPGRFLRLQFADVEFRDRIRLGQSYHETRTSLGYGFNF